MTQEERIAALEGEVRRLKDKPRDKWDKFSAVTAALIPLSIASVGGYYTYQSESTKTKLARIDAQTAEQTRKSDLEKAQRKRPPIPA